MATVTVTDTFTNVSNSGRKTVLAANPSKRYTSTSYTVTYKAKNNHTTKAATVTFKIGQTDWGSNDATTNLGTMTVAANASVNKTVTFQKTFQTDPNFALICKQDSDHSMTGTATWTVTYTEQIKPQVAVGDPIKASQITAMNTWRSGSKFSASTVGSATAGNIIDNANMTKNTPTQGSTIYASYYNGL